MFSSLDHRPGRGSASQHLCAGRIVQAIGDATARWLDADFPARVRAVRDVERRTGYTEPVVDYALDSLFGELSGAALEAAIANELGSVEALDAFSARAGQASVRFVSAGDVAIVASNTTIGVALPALAFALCAGARVLVKDRVDHLTGAFAETLFEERPELRERVLVRTWDGEHDTGANAALGEFATVVAYGRDATLRTLRAALPATTRLIGFGARTSIAYLPRESLANAEASRAIADGLARDALLYDGEGCLSIHVAFVERGGALDPATFARVAGAACDAAAVEFPAGYQGLDEAAAACYRQASFRASQGEGAVIGGMLASHLVLLDPPRDAPPPWARRTLVLYAVDGPDEAAVLLRDFGLALEAFGTALPSRDDVARLALDSGAVRIARLGELQRPPLGGTHGGIGRILPFVRAITRD